METQSIVVRLPDDSEEDFILFVEVPDQEEGERNEFELDEAVANFKDEGFVWHDVYPDSDEDKEAKASVRVDIKRGDGRLYEDQKFYNGVAFKEAVLDYALRTGRNLSQTRYDKTKLEFKCIGAGCSWRIYCATTRKSSLWRVRVFHNVHTCVPNGECDMIKVPVTARLFLDKIREEPEYYMPMKIKKFMQERWRITVSRHQYQAGRKKARGWIATEYAEQFSRLRDYGAELEFSNEGSTVEIDTIKNAAGNDVFNRFYVCFDVMRRTWKDTCRPLIGVDASFLRSTTKGQLLVALGRDVDNAIYPVAWSVVKVENFDNWLWFVKKIKADLGLGDGEGYILVSDRSKGLIKAAQLELPHIEHRKCIRHIYGNIKAIHGKKKMKKFIWNLAWSYNEPEYRANLERLREYDVGVYNDVMKTNPKTWCRAFHKIGNYCEDVENNSVESFNSSIVKAREKPFMPMLETIRRLAMARIAEKSARSHNHKGIFTPYVAKFLAAEHKKASQCTITSSTNGMHESVFNGEPFRVNMEKRTCSCRKWDICGIPCVHAYGVILKKTLDLDQYVCHWFRTTMWRRNYTEGLAPIRGIRFWPTTNAPLVHEIPAEEDDDDNDPTEPQKKKKTKIDKKWKRRKNESPVKKKPIEKKRIMHCGICGTANHNSRFHNKKSKQVGEPSQGELSQGIHSQIESSSHVVGRE